MIRDAYMYIPLTPTNFKIMNTGGQQLLEVYPEGLIMKSRTTGEHTSRKKANSRPEILKSCGLAFLKDNNFNKNNGVNKKKQT